MVKYHMPLKLKLKLNNFRFKLWKLEYFKFEGLEIDKIQLEIKYQEFEARKKKGNIKKFDI